MSANKLTSLSLSIVLGAMCTPVFAQTPTAPSTGAAPVRTGPAPDKIAILNVQQAILETDEGKQESDALAKKFSARQADLAKLKDEIDNMQKQLQAQGDKLNDEERNNRLQTIDTKQKQLQRNSDDFQSDVQQAEQDAINRIGTKMITVLDKYASSNGFAVVLDVSNSQSVLWASQGTVITQDLVAAYNAANPVAKPAAAAAAPAPSASAPPPSGAPELPSAPVKKP